MHKPKNEVLGSNESLTSADDVMGITTRATRETQSTSTESHPLMRAI